MPKKSAHEHSSGTDYKTKAEGENHDKKHGHLMEGIVAGCPKRTMPPTIDGIVRGVQKYKAVSLDADVSKVKPSATKNAYGSFGSSAFPEGKTGK